MSTATEVPDVATGGSRRSRWMPRGILAATMLVTGAAGLVYEYVLSTVFSYLLGSSIEQFSVTIGVMFFMMGVGCWLQARLKDSLVEFFVGAELLLVLAGGFAPIALQWTFANMPDDFGLVKFAYPALIGMLIGVEIPLVMRINEKFAKSLRSNIAGTWAWDYAGGAVGVIVWLWLLHHYVPITHISFYVAASNLLVAIVSLVFFWRRGMLRWRISRVFAPVMTVMVALMLLLGANGVNAWSATINQKLYEDPIVFAETTKYQNIVLTKGPHPSNPHDFNYQLYLNGNKQFASADEAIYHEYLIHPAMTMAPRHNHVLVLGGGDGMAMREILKYKDVQDVTLVDLDPDMIKLSSANPIMRKLNHDSFGDARVHSSLTDPKLNAGVTDTGKKQDVLLDTGQTKKVDCQEIVSDQGRTVSDCDVDPVTQKVASVDIYTIDADRFVSAAGHGPYDVVVIDLPDPNSVELSKLYSKEFYAKVKSLMAPDGMVVVQATSPYHSKETYLCILRTMAAAGLNVLPYHDNVPSFGDWGWIIGSPTVSDRQLYEMADNLKPFSVPTREVTAANMTRALIFNRGWLKSDRTEISTLMRPIVYDYYNYEGWRVD